MYKLVEQDEEYLKSPVTNLLQKILAINLKSCMLIMYYFEGFFSGANLQKIDRYQAEAKIQRPNLVACPVVINIDSWTGLW